VTGWENRDFWQGWVWVALVSFYSDVYDVVLEEGVGEVW